MNVYDWPLIESNNWIYCPLIPDEAILAELKGANIEVPNLLPLKAIDEDIPNFDPKVTAVNKSGDLIIFHQRSRPEVCELMKISGNEVVNFYTFPKFTLVSFIVFDSEDELYVFADVANDSEPPGFSVYDVYIFYPRGVVRRVYKDFRMREDSIVLSPIVVALCAPDKNRDRIPRKVVDESGMNALAEVAGGREVSIPGEAADESGMNILGEVTGEREVSLPGEAAGGTEINVSKEVSSVRERNDPGENPNLEISNDLYLAAKSIELIFKAEMTSPSLVAINHQHRVAIMEQYGHHVRVFDRHGDLVKEFSLHEGDRESCVGIAFSNISVKEELIVVSRIDGEYFLSTYTLESRGKRQHHVRLAHLSGCSLHDIHLSSHPFGRIALISKKYVLYIQ